MAKKRTKAGPGTKIKTDAKAKGELLRSITAKAEQHGLDSEPDMEVGDLQMALGMAFDTMTLDQARAVVAGFHECFEDE